MLISISAQGERVTLVGLSQSMNLALRVAVVSGAIAATIAGSAFWSTAGATSRGESELKPAEKLSCATWIREVSPKKVVTRTCPERWVQYKFGKDRTVEYSTFVAGIGANGFELSALPVLFMRDYTLWTSGANGNDVDSGSRLTVRTYGAPTGFADTTVWSVGQSRGVRNSESWWQSSKSGDATATCEFWEVCSPAPVSTGAAGRA